ncbi:hypothetical protein L7F22_048719 [Adiantum nelumboides]|nr:hypothetical protein [Adiantum nelumboides]
MQQLRVRRSSSNGDGGRSAQRRPTEEVVEVSEGREEGGRLFVWLLAFRALVSLATSRAAFAPDEHWQSLEVAHRIVFGYGYQTWEWRDNRTTPSAWSDGPIRTVLYPALFVPVYAVLKWTALDDATLLLSLAPGLVQTVFAPLAICTRSSWRARCCRRMTRLPGPRSWPISSPSTLCTHGHAHPLQLPRGHADRRRTLLLSPARHWVYYVLAAHLPRPLCARCSTPAVQHCPLAAPRRCPPRPPRPLRLTQSCGRARRLVLGRRPPRLSRPPDRRLDLLWPAHLHASGLSAKKRARGHLALLWRLALPLLPHLGLPLVCFTTLPWTLLGLSQALKGGVRSSGSPTKKNNKSLATLARVTLLFVAGMSLLGHKEQRFLQPVVPLLHLFEGLALYQSDEHYPRGEEKKKKKSSDHGAKTPPPQRLLRSLARLKRRKPWPTPPCSPISSPPHTSLHTAAAPRASWSTSLAATTSLLRLRMDSLACSCPATRHRGSRTSTRPTSAPGSSLASPRWRGRTSQRTRTSQTSSNRDPFCLSCG